MSYFMLLDIGQLLPKVDRSRVSGSVTQWFRKTDFNLNTHLKSPGK